MIRVTPVWRMLWVIGVLLLSMGCAEASSDIDWPAKISGLNGWHGLKLERGRRCKVCYSLVIPDDFGFDNEKELRILTELPKKRVDDINYDLDGPLFDDSDILDHFLHLALDKGSIAAARRIIDPEKYQMAIGVETSEDIGGKYIIPLLLKFHDLNALVGESEYKKLAVSVCTWSAMNADFRAADNLISNLKKRRYNALAVEISNACNAEKKAMQENGELPN